MTPKPAATEERRAIKTLEGMLLGFAADNYIQDEELAALDRFFRAHSHLSRIHPFCEVEAELARVFAGSGQVDEQCRACFLEYCLNYEPSYTDEDPCDDDLRELHGFMAGIVADGVLNAAEVEALSRWLRTHEYLQGRFPCRELAQLLQDLLYAKGDRSTQERAIFRFCVDLSERPIECPETASRIFERQSWARSQAPVCKPAHGFCDPRPNIVFEGRRFCFTGRAKIGSRRDLEAIATELGGSASSSLGPSVDYLVIGHESSPAWKFSSYGRKVEKAMGLRTQGHAIAIITEAHFAAAAGCSWLD